jgi:L-iditol 2-dehydrogenase
VRVGGRVVIVGIPRADRTAFAAALPRRKGVSLVFARRMKAHHLSRAIDMAAHELVDLSPLVTARYPLAQSTRAFDDLVARNGLKIVVEPSA